MTANQHTAAKIIYFSFSLSPYRHLCHAFRDINGSAFVVILAAPRLNVRKFFVYILKYAEDIIAMSGFFFFLLIISPP